MKKEQLVNPTDKSTVLCHHPDRLIRLCDVIILTGYCKSSIYQKIHNGLFPGPKKIGSRAVAWRFGDIQQWLTSRPDAIEI